MCAGHARCANGASELKIRTDSNAVLRGGGGLPGPPTGRDLGSCEVPCRYDLSAFGVRSGNVVTVAAKPVFVAARSGHPPGRRPTRPLELRALFGSSRVREVLPRRDSHPPIGVASPLAPTDAPISYGACAARDWVDGSETSISSHRGSRRTRRHYACPTLSSMHIRSARRIFPQWDAVAETAVRSFRARPRPGPRLGPRGVNIRIPVGRYSYTPRLVGRSGPLRRAGG